MKKLDGAKKAAPKKKPDLKIQKLQARWSFTDKEMAEIARESGRAQNDITSLEEQLGSIKKDYASKIESAENRRNDAFRKLEQGFEMREIEAVVLFNIPEKGKKSVFRYDPKKKGGKGEFVLEEAMTPADAQAEVFDKEKPGAAKGEGTEITEAIIKEATVIVRKAGKASIALIQREMKIGYTRSGKIIEALFDAKIIGPAKGSEPREVLPEPLNPVLSEEDAAKVNEKENQTATEE